MKQSGHFNDLRLNIILEGIDGEIDIAAVSNGRLVLVECKSNVQETQQLSKLDSFRQRLGGPFAKASYARASEAYQKRIKQKCQKYKIEPFFGSELCDIGDKIGEQLI